MLIALIHNVALLLVLAVGLNFLYRSVPGETFRLQILCGFLYGLMGIFVMLTPLHFAPGVIYDGRSIVLSLAGMFGGPIPTLIAATSCGLFRIYLGGDGTVAGVAVVVEASALGLALHHLRRADPSWDRPMKLLLFGFVVHAGMLALQFLIPGGTGWEVLKRLGPVVLVTFPVAFVLAAHIFLEGERRIVLRREISQSEERYRSLFEKNHAVMLLIDPVEGIIVDANVAASKFYGWSLAQLRGKPISEINIQDPSNIQEKLGLVQAGKKSHFFFTHRIADGTLREVEVYTGQIRVQERDLLYSIVHDVTEQKRAEEEKRGRETYLQTVLQTTADGFWVLDRAGRVLEANQTYCEMTGYGQDEIVALTIGDLNAYETSAGIENRMRKIMAEGSATFPTTHRRKDGSTFPIEVSVTWLPERGGQFICFGRDLTERAQREEEVREANRRMKATIRAANVGLWDWNLETNRVHYSTEWKKQIGYKKDEIGDGFEEWESRVHPDDLGPAMERVRKALEQLEQEYSVEFRLRHKDGGYRWILAQGSVIQDEAGKPVRVMGSHVDITYKKRQEEYLGILGQMLDEAPALIAVHDIEGHILYANRQTLLLHGYDNEAEFMALNMHDLDVPETGNLKEQRYNKIEESGEARFEVSHYRKDGSIFPMEVFAKKTLWNGKPAIMSLASDITERKEAAQRIEESHALLEKLSNLVPGVIYQYRLFPDGRSAFPYSSEGMKTIYEVTCEEVREDASPVFARLHPEDQDRISQEIWDSARNLSHFSTQYRVILPRQGLRWRQSEAVPQRMEDGGTLWHGIITDITDRKHSEEELRESEERFRLLLNDVSMVSVQGYGPDARIRYWNEGSRKIYGYSEQEAIGEDLVELIIPPEMREEVRRGIESMAQTLAPIPSGELELMRKDGSRVWVYSSHCILNRPGLPLEFYCVDIDLTEIRQAEQDREQMRERLNQAQKMESVGRLAGGVAHDFNNMLNVILGHASLALEEAEPEGRLREDLSEIQKAAKRSADLTRQLLAFARKQTVAPKVLDLNETVDSMLKMLGRLIGEDIHLVWKPGEKVDPVFIDPAQIDQLLANLCVNSRDAIGHRNGKVTIETALVVWDEEDCGEEEEFKPGRYAMLSVSDDGCGMNETVKSHIFEPFFTTKKVGEGTGLGLATIYGIVKQNGGFIHVYSEAEKGTTFRIYLPVHSAEAKPPPSQGGGGSVVPIGDETILIVEDEPAILMLTRKILERKGYKLLAASSPEEAIQVVESHPGPVHLLISDVIMPQMDGRDLSRRLNAIRPGLKTLFMSGYTADVIAHQGVLEEGVDFIQKPFANRDLAIRVREALDRQ